MSVYRTQVFEWFKRFKEGREEIRDDQGPGLSSTSNTDANIEKKSVKLLDKVVTRAFEQLLS